MIKKRICSIMLAFIATVLCLVTPAFAASDMKLTDAVYPTSIIEGNAFSVYGVITSSNNIMSVTVGAYNADGTAAFSYTGKPGRTTYDIHNIDYLLTFSKLKAGNYTYKIIASDTVQSNVTLLSKNFKVTSSSLALSGGTYPTSLVQGGTFSVYGTVTSDYTITSVTAGVYNSSGTAQFSKTVSPNAYSYSIHDIDSYMTFSKLTPGTYSYKITASDSMSSNFVLLSKTFTVSSVIHEDPNLTSVNWNVLDLSVWNTISSWTKIADSVDGLILRIGFRGTVNREISADTKFVELYNSAKAQNIHVGCYFFSNALTVEEAIEEADFVISTLKSNGCKLDMPVYIDMETEAQVNLSRSECTEIAKAFCKKMKDNGYYSGIYCNKYFARDELFAAQLSDYQFWIAQYDTACTYEGDYGMWQYSKTGTNPGISGNVDTNYCYFNYPEYIIKNKLNGYSSTSQTPVFDIKGGSGAVIDKTAKTISKVAEGLSTSDFSSKYLSTSNVTLSFEKTVNNMVASGTAITVKSDTGTLGTYTVAVLGDVNADAKVNSTDALNVLQCSVGSISLTSIQKLSADYSGDGKVNSTDALQILKHSVGA